MDHLAFLSCAGNEAEEKSAKLKACCIYAEEEARWKNHTAYGHTACSIEEQKEPVAIDILHQWRRQMNCSFIAYPAEPGHNTVLEVFIEPIGRKDGEGKKLGLSK